MVQLRLVIFLVGAILLFVNSMRDIFPEFFSREYYSDRKINFPVGGEITSFCNTLFEIENVFNRIWSQSSKFWLLWSRVPDHAELEHRYVLFQEILSASNYDI